MALSCVPFGLSYGAVSVAAGFSVPQTCVLSLVLFSGASQFALVSVGTGALLSGVVSALLLGVRNGLYGARVASLLRPARSLLPLAVHWTIDETTAMTVAEDDPGLAALGFWTTAGALFLLWNTSTLAGALVGDALGSPSRAGLDAAGPATFLALVVPRLGSATAWRVAVAAAATALLTTPLLPAGAPILAATAVGLLTVPRGRERR